MACSCNCSPCNCQPRPSTCCTPTTESVEYTFENANAAGIGVFDNDTDNLVQFRGIVSDSASLTVTLNATDNTIVLDFDDAALVADIPDATTTQRGILETATNAEALAKAATDKTLTPSNLAALGSTTTFAGLVELATTAETIAGISTTLAVTPAGLAAAGATYGTTTFADAVARAAASPSFDGQFGSQLDTNTGWMGTGTGAGQWLQIPTSNADWGPASIPVTWTVQSDLTFDGDGGGGTLTFSDFSTITLDGTQIDFGTGGGSTVVNFENASFQISGVAITDTFLLSAGPAGAVTSTNPALFLSTFNTQTGWGTPSGTLARTTFASYAGATISNPPTQAEVQAIDDALVIVSRRLAALITDLKAVLLPAT